MAYFVRYEVVARIDGTGWVRDGRMVAYVASLPSVAVSLLLCDFPRVLDLVMGQT